MEIVKCDLCDSEKYEILFHQTDLLHQTTKETFQMVRCKDCGLCYINPRPTENEIGKYYSETYSFHDDKSKLKIILLDFLLSLTQSAYYDDNSSLKKILSQILLLPLYYLPKVNKRILSSIRPKIKSYININLPQRIIDIGCGSGVTIHLHSPKEAIIALSKKGWEVYGVEASNEARNILNKKGIKNI